MPIFRYCSGRSQVYNPIFSDLYRCCIRQCIWALRTLSWLQSEVKSCRAEHLRASESPPVLPPWIIPQIGGVLFPDFPLPLSPRKRFLLPVLPFVATTRRWPLCLVTIYISSRFASSFKRARTFLQSLHVVVRPFIAHHHNWGQVLKRFDDWRDWILWSRSTESIFLRVDDVPSTPFQWDHQSIFGNSYIHTVGRETYSANSRQIRRFDLQKGQNSLWPTHFSHGLVAIYTIDQILNVEAHVVGLLTGLITSHRLAKGTAIESKD